MVTKETIYSRGGMDNREFKFRKVLEPVTATTDGILVRVLRHQPFYAVRKFRPGFYCFYYVLFVGRMCTFHKPLYCACTWKIVILAGTQATGTRRAYRKCPRTSRWQGC